MSWVKFFKKKKLKNQSTPQKMRDIIAGGNEHKLHLKDKSWKLEFSIGGRDIRRFLRRYQSVAVYTILGIIASAGFIGYFLTSRATIAEFYPSSCLGGWENPEKAQGKPDVQADASAESFIKENSAVLHNIVSEIFCGNFEGEIPKDSQPKKAVLKISWAVKSAEKEMFPKEEATTTADLVQIIKIEDGSTTIINLDSSGTINEIDNLNVTSSVETNEGSAPEKNKDENNTSSFLDKFINLTFKSDLLIVRAEENSSTSESSSQNSSNAEITSKTSQESLSAAPGIASGETSLSEASASSSLLPSNEAFPQMEAGGGAGGISDQTAENENINIEMLQDTTSTNESSESSPATSSDREDIPALADNLSDFNASSIEEIHFAPPDFIEISYTLDGVNWRSLAKINAANWKNAEWELPGFNWEDISKFQVRISALSPADYLPAIYLDGMRLIVEYEERLPDNSIGAQPEENTTSTAPISISTSSANLESINSSFTGPNSAAPAGGSSALPPATSLFFSVESSFGKSFFEIQTATSTLTQNMVEAIDGKCALTSYFIEKPDSNIYVYRSDELSAAYTDFGGKIIDAQKPVSIGMNTKGEARCLLDLYHPGKYLLIEIFDPERTVCADNVSYSVCRAKAIREFSMELINR